jgi:hypothetical protein
MLARFVLITFHPILIFTHRGRAVSTSSGAAVRAVIRRYLTLPTPPLILPPPHPHPLPHPPSSSSYELYFTLIIGRPAIH